MSERARPPGENEERDARYGIGEVASRADVSERTLRYYEEVGLLVPAAHQPGHNRRYCDADVRRVLRIRELQSLMGFNLDEIRNVISAEDRLDALRTRYRGGADATEQKALLEEAERVLEGVRGEVTAKLERLSAFLAELDERIERHRRRLRAPSGRLAHSSFRPPR